MLADVPDSLPMTAVPFRTGQWYVTWSQLTGAVVFHRQLSTRTKVRHAGTARTPKELAAVVQACAREFAAAAPCPTGKKRLGSEEDARRALGQALTSTFGHRREQRYYQCPQCGDWHLTSLRAWGYRR